MDIGMTVPTFPPMSVFTVVQKRAYLQAVLARSSDSDYPPTTPLAELQAIPSRTRRQIIENLEESLLDDLISAHIRSVSKRISTRFQMESAALQPA